MRRWQGSIQDFFAGEGKWDAQTMHLLSFVISAALIDLMGAGLAGIQHGIQRETGATGCHTWKLRYGLTAVPEDVWI